MHVGGGEVKHTVLLVGLSTNPIVASTAFAQMCCSKAPEAVVGTFPLTRMVRMFLGES